MAYFRTRHIKIIHPKSIHFKNKQKHSSLYKNEIKLKVTIPKCQALAESSSDEGPKKSQPTKTAQDCYPHLFRAERSWHEVRQRMASEIEPWPPSRCRWPEALQNGRPRTLLRRRSATWSDVGRPHYRPTTLAGSLKLKKKRSALAPLAFLQFQ